MSFCCVTTHAHCCARVQIGDSVAPGDLYCEVETDKATIGWESQEEGFIAQILLPAGTKDIAVGTPIVVLVEDKVRVWVVGVGDEQNFDKISVCARRGRDQGHCGGPRTLRWACPLWCWWRTR